MPWTNSKSDTTIAFTVRAATSTKSWLRSAPGMTLLTIRPVATGTTSPSTAELRPSNTRVIQSRPVRNNPNLTMSSGRSARASNAR